MSSRAAFELLLELNDKASSGMKKAAKEGGFLSNALSFATGGLIVKGMEAIGGAAKDMFGDSVEEAKEARRGMAQLEAVLQSTGGAAGVTRDKALALADSLSAAGGLSTASDDAVLAAENMLLTFTNIKDDVFPGATQTVLDMATAMNNGATPSAQELAAQAQQLGKALQDPEKGITALTRVGVTFTDEQKNMIKALQDTGDTAGAQKIILDELNKEFGGSAKAAADASGGMAQLDAKMDNLKQRVGEALLPIMDGFVSFLNTTALPAVEGLMTAFSSGNPDDFKKAIEGLPAPIQAIIAPLGDIAVNMGKFFQAVSSGDPAAVKQFFTDLGGPIGVVGGVLTDVATNAGKFFQAVASGDKEAVLSFWRDLGGPIGFVGEKLTEATTGVVDFFKGMNGEGSAGANAFWTNFNTGLDTANKGLVVAQTEGSKFWNDVLNVQAGETPFEAMLREANEGLGVFKERVNESQTEGREFWSTVIQIAPGETPFAAAVRTAGDNLQTFKERVNLSQAEGRKFWDTVMQVPPGETPWDTMLKNGTSNVDTFRERTALSQAEGTKFWSTVIQVKEGETPFEAALNRANENLTTLKNTVTTWGGQMVDNFKKGVSAVWSTVTGIGASIIEGVKQGITNGWNSFTTWIRDKFVGAVNAVKSALGIHSPSQLMADEVGAPIVQGLRRGIQDEWQQFFLDPTLADMDTAIAAMKARAQGDAALEAGRALVASATAGAHDECPTLSEQVESCVSSAVSSAEAYAASPEAKTPGQMVAWAIRDGILDEQDQVYDTFRTFWDGLWGIASQRAAEIQALINNTVASGSASSAGTGAVNPGTGGAGGGGGQVLDTGGIVTEPTRAFLAMNRRPEAVIPLDRLGSMLGGRGGWDRGAARPVYVTIGTAIGMDEHALARYIGQILYDHDMGRI